MRSVWPMKKGKLGKPVQWGYKVQIIVAESGFVTDDTGSIGIPPDEAALGLPRTASRPVWG